VSADKDVQNTTSETAMTRPSLTCSLALFASAALVAGAASTAAAAPSSNDNTGVWSDSYSDDNGIATFDGTRFDGPGRRVLLEADAATGTFETTPIAPASFSAWNRLYLDANRPSDATLHVWVTDGDTVYGATVGTRANLPAPLPLSTSDLAGYNFMASLASVPTTAGSLRLLVRLDGPTVSPAVNAARVNWTPRSVLSMRLDSVDTVPSRGELAYRVNVGVSFVDTTDLVVELPVPAALANPRSQDQSLELRQVSDGGQLSADGTRVIWHLGSRKAGETFTLICNFRTRMGLLNGTTYAATASAAPGNGTSVAAGPKQTVITSAPNLEFHRSYGGVYRVNNVDYAFADSEIRVNLWGWNHRNVPATGGETLFDAVIWDDVSDLVREINGQPVSGGPFDISHGGLYTATQMDLGNGKIIPAHSVYWLPGDLTVGQAFSYNFRLRLAPRTPDGPFEGGERMSDCATAESFFSPQTGHIRGPLCREFFIGVPSTPGWAFAKGQRIRQHSRISGGVDLRPPNYPTTVKAAFGETMSYFLHTSNAAVSELNDVVMIDRIPDAMLFEAAVLPPSSNGTIWYYAGLDGADFPADSPPDFDLTDGTFGPGWTTTPPAAANAVKWVAFREPRLASTYFPDPDGAAPTSITAELVVTVAPPDGPCPLEDIDIENIGIFHIFGYTPQQESTQPLPNGPVRTLNSEWTLISPDLPNLAASTVSRSPTTANANDPLVYTVRIRNDNPSTVNIPLDDSLNTRVRVNIPTVPANGVSTHLLLDSITAPGGTIAYHLPTHVIVSYAAAIPPTESRLITLRTRVPNGVLDKASFTLTARADYSDDLCGDFQQDISITTGFFGVPALEVSKSSDFANGQTGTALTWTLD